MIAADKAHNARDVMIDSSRNPESWTLFKQGVLGACWTLSSLHSQLQQKLPNSRSVRQLEAIKAGEAVPMSLEPGRRAQKCATGYLVAA